MEPKFQSSFIPKGPAAAMATGSAPVRRRGAERGIVSFIASIVFILSVIAAGGAFGYKYYLKYRIDQMGVDLEQARAALQSETISELVRLDKRMVSTRDIIAGHKVVSPLFRFLEESTPRTVRFSEFQYNASESGIELTMIGEARGYAALAYQADIFNRSQYFKDPVFSDLSLNDNGDVIFSFKATMDPSLISYKRQVEGLNIPILPPISEPADDEASSTSSTSSPISN